VSAEAIIADSMPVFSMIAMAGVVLWALWLLNASNDRAARRYELDNSDFFRQIEEQRQRLAEQERFRRSLAELDRKLTASQQQHKPSHTRDFSGLTRNPLTKESEL
jgi:hypothetical protein